MDFRNVTDLFADKDFDGEPVMIKDLSQDDEMPAPEDEMQDDTPVIDEESGEEIEFEQPADRDVSSPLPQGGEIVAEAPAKYYVNGVDVSVLHERVQYIDAQGKLITENLKDYTRACVRKQYASLHDFLNKWEHAERKQAIIQELEEQGIILENFQEEINREMDIFDLICHAAFDQPPLTRRERALNVKKRNYTNCV